jgi:hypothetical protein
VAPSAINVGQIVQVRMKFRLLKQENGSFTFRELLKGVYVLHDGASMVCDGSAFGMQGWDTLTRYPRRLPGFTP